MVDPFCHASDTGQSSFRHACIAVPTKLYIQVCSHLVLLRRSILGSSNQLQEEPLHGGRSGPGE